MHILTVRRNSPYYKTTFHTFYCKINHFLSESLRDTPIICCKQPSKNIIITISHIDLESATATHIRYGSATGRTDRPRNLK